MLTPNQNGPCGSHVMSAVEMDTTAVTLVSLLPLGLTGEDRGPEKSDPREYWQRESLTQAPASRPMCSQVGPASKRRLRGRDGQRWPAQALRDWGVNAPRRGLCFRWASEERHRAPARHMALTSPRCFSVEPDDCGQALRLAGPQWGAGPESPLSPSHCAASSHSLTLPLRIPASRPQF